MSSESLLATSAPLLGGDQPLNIESGVSGDETSNIKTGVGSECFVTDRRGKIG
jgi:hypothetical protein